MILLLSLCLTGLTTLAQGHAEASSMKYLEDQFPQLTKLYEPELRDMNTHYIFAIDVSGSMKKYDEVVTPALKAFARALPNGEEVSVIPFGTDAKLNVPGLCVKIEGEGTKQALETALSTLYINDGYDRAFRANTDVAKAVEAVNTTMRNNQDVKMNVVVIITDFLNDLPNQGEVQIHPGNLVQLQKDFENVSDNSYTRVVAMKLPPMGSGKGYSLDQLKTEVFNNTGQTRKFDVVDAISNEAAISHWFEQLSREIMTEKLRAVIQLDNEKNLKPSLKTDIDIDGNTTAEIHWTPNKLYREMRIDSTYTDAGSDYIFVNNKEVWQNYPDTVLKDVKLGKLKHKNLGLHHYDEPLNIGLSLPTPYDDELKKLSIDKPLPETSDVKNGWLWTFWISFGVCCAILVLLIIYLFLVFKAAKRNVTEKFKGTVDILPMGKKTKDKARQVTIPATNKFDIGKNGTMGCTLPNVPWDLQVAKKTYNPFTLKKPVFVVKKMGDYVEKSKKNTLSRYGNGSTGLNYQCGNSDSDITHQVSIRINRK